MVVLGAQFGVPLYGGALTGEIVYMENNKLGCSVFERPLVPETLPVFLLVDRGDCYFVEKVHFPMHTQPAQLHNQCTATQCFPGMLCQGRLGFVPEHAGHAVGHPPPDTWPSTPVIRRTQLRCLACFGMRHLTRPSAPRPGVQC